MSIGYLPITEFKRLEKTMLKFSVIMSIYKSDVPEYVRIALDSILNQTLLPNEIVIVGDGPVPAPLEQVIRDVQSSISSSNLPVEINYLPQEKNRGLGEALRIAVENAKYDYLARMDSDDICMPDRFEKQMRCFEEDPDLSIVGGMITEFVDSPDNVVDKRVLPLDDEGIKRFMRSRCGVNHVTVIFKKADLLRSGNYRSDYRQEDYYLWARMLKAGCKFRNIPDVVVNELLSRPLRYFPVHVSRRTDFLSAPCLQLCGSWSCSVPHAELIAHLGLSKLAAKMTLFLYDAN